MKKMKLKKHTENILFMKSFIPKIILKKYYLQFGLMEKKIKEIKNK